MARPQLENGFTRVSNELFETILRAKFTGGQFGVVGVIIRKTYGFHKKKDRISLSQFTKMTNISRRHICDVIKSLEARHVIVVDRRGSISVFQLNKDYDEWGSEPEFPREPQLTRVGNPTSLEVGNHSSPTKETLKETLQKKLPAALEDEASGEVNYEIDEDLIPIKDRKKAESRSAGVQDKKVINEILKWGEVRMGARFPNRLMQITNIAKMLKSGYSGQAIMEEWERLEEDEFWSEKGMHFGVVLNNIGKARRSNSIPTLS